MMLCVFSLDGGVRYVHRSEPTHESWTPRGNTYRPLVRETPFPFLRETPLSHSPNDVVMWRENMI